jgi:hypothetical protein
VQKGDGTTFPKRGDMLTVCCPRTRERWGRRGRDREREVQRQMQSQRQKQRQRQRQRPIQRHRQAGLEAEVVAEGRRDNVPQGGRHAHGLSPDERERQTGTETAAETAAETETDRDMLTVRDPALSPHEREREKERVGLHPPLFPPTRERGRK